MSNPLSPDWRGGSVAKTLVHGGFLSSDWRGGSVAKVLFRGGLVGWDRMMGKLLTLDWDSAPTADDTRKEFCFLGIKFR